MSSTELSRLLEVIRKDPCLKDESREVLGDLDLALRWARDKGYHLTQADVQELLDSNRELSDEDLDQAAGGDSWPLP